MAIERLRTRRTTTKATPEATDLELSEMGYSFKSNRLFMRNQVTGDVECIGGKDIVDMVLRMNQATVLTPDSGSLTDAQGTLSGNVTLNDVDGEGDTFHVSTLSHADITRAVGSTFSTAYGSFSMQASGAWTYTVGAAGRALTVGQSATEVFSYRVTDARLGVSNVTTLTVSLVGSNQGPVVSSDNGMIPVNGSASGNVLANDSDYEGDALSVVQFSYVGSPAPFAAGATATIAGVGQLTIAVNGAWSFTPAQDYSGVVPLITYIVSDGTSSNSETLTLVIEQPAATYAQTIAWFMQYASGQIAATNIASNPPPARPAPTPITATIGTTYPGWNYSLVLPNQSGETGSSLHFRVGADKEYKTLHAVPWNQLLPGDKVLVDWRPEPYKECVAIHQRGTSTRWIEIIGVPGPNGELPIISGMDAVENPDSLYNQYTFGGGGFCVRSPNGGSATYKPAFIHIHGFEFRDFLGPNRYTNYAGVNMAWGTFAAGINGQGYDNLTVSGCRFTGNGLGIFGICNPGLGERLMSRYLHVIFNHFTANGVNTPGADARYETHNAYTELACSIYEFNYFDPVSTGNFGDLFKDRASGNVVRYNKFVAGGANALSIRDPEASFDAVLNLQDKFGQVMHNYSYVYGNSFELVDSVIAVAHGDGLKAIHGQVRGGGRVYFYNNRVVCRNDNPSGYYEGFEYKPYPFVLFCPINTRLQTKFYAQNNLFFAEKATASGLETELAIFYWQGDGEFNDNIAHKVRPVYMISGIVPRADNLQARGARSTETMETLGLVNVTTDQKFLDFEGYDFTLLDDAPFYDLAAAPYADAVQRGLVPQGDPVSYPLNRVPAPVLRIRPAISGSVVVGSTLTLAPGLYTPLPVSRTYQWMRDSLPIAGATGLTYVTVEADIQAKITCVESVTNQKGTTVVSSLDVTIISQTTPQPVLAPIVTGSGQATFPLTVGQDTWTTPVVSRTYQWKLEDGTPIAGQTTDTFTADVSYIGGGVYCTIAASGASGEIGYANSNVVQIIPVDLDPDVNGVFNFAAPNGTLLKDLDAGWGGTDTVSYGVTNAMFECKDGAIVTNALYIINSSSPTWYAGRPQNDDQKVKITFDRPLNNGVIYLYLQSRVGQAGYSCAIGAANVTMNKLGAGIWFVPSVAHNLPATDCQVIMEKVGNVIKLYGQTGETLLTFTDDGSFNGPLLAGGYPGFSLFVSSVANNTDAAIKSFTDNPQ